MISQTTRLILAIGLLIRFIAPNNITGLTNILDKSVLFSTPINSYRSLQEGVFLLKNGLDPYSGTIVHHPPLILSFFSIFNSNITLTNFVFALIDIIIAYKIICINENLKKKNDSKDRYDSSVIALFYILNPLTLLTTYAKSTVLISNLFIVCMTNELILNNFSLSIIYLALASYISYYPWYFIIPVSYYIYLNKNEKNNNVSLFGSIFRVFMFFLYVIGTLFGTSYLITNSWSFLEICYGTVIMFKKINPNLGLWWYFFTEMFEFFSKFFIVVFNIYSFIFVIPVTIRFSKNLIFAIWILIGFINFSKAYVTIGDISLFFGMLLIWKPLFKRLRVSPLISLLSILVLLILLPVFYYVWMNLYSGNANFFYAIGLAFSLLQNLILTDFIWSYLQIDYIEENKIEDSVKLTQL
ncbi:hypothetical protein B5S28_g2152 [[Candida] boidinii]|nr:hypothetical protein B5S28_g2152 [[Candida] boidinii]OWB72898.1 hypothetical protein B5S31_g2623 [[Candida] boidinii]OWB78437.1 hypothetical protein B5S32_g2631 [[Candida] boidinii]